MNAADSLKPNTLPESEPRSSRVFFKIASFATALGFGGAAASTASLRSSPGGFSFHISVGTFVAFAIGAAVGLFYWKLVAQESKAARRATFFIALGGVGLFLYPLRFVPAGNLLDLAVGLILATIALSLVGFLLWQVKRFLDLDSQQADAAPEPPAKPDRPSHD